MPYKYDLNRIVNSIFLNEPRLEMAQLKVILNKNLAKPNEAKRRNKN